MSHESPTLFIFIPAYNAARTISEVLARIPDETWEIIDTVTVVDDGSVDETAGVVSALRAQYPKLALESFPENRGYGIAVRRGLQLARLSQAEFCGCLHADGQYPPEKLAAFMAHMALHAIDVLQGSRHRDGTAYEGGMPVYKIVAGKVLTGLENAVFGLRLTDYHSGFLMYSRSALTGIPFESLSRYFEFDLEVIASARARGLMVAELGIPTHYGDEVSYLNPVFYGLRVLRVLWRYLRGRYAPPAPPQRQPAVVSRR